MNEKQLTITMSLKGDETEQTVEVARLAIELLGNAEMLAKSPAGSSWSMFEDGKPDGQKIGQVKLDHGDDMKRALVAAIMSAQKRGDKEVETQ